MLDYKAALKLAKRCVKKEKHWASGTVDIFTHQLTMWDGNVGCTVYGEFPNRIRVPFEQAEAACTDQPVEGLVLKDYPDPKRGTKLGELRDVRGLLTQLVEDAMLLEQPGYLDDCVYFSPETGILTSDSVCCSVQVNHHNRLWTMAPGQTATVKVPRRFCDVMVRLGAPDSIVFRGIMICAHYVGYTLWAIVEPMKFDLVKQVWDLYKPRLTDAIIDMSRTADNFIDWLGKNDYQFEAKVNVFRNNAVSIVLGNCEITSASNAYLDNLYSCVPLNVARLKRILKSNQFTFKDDYLEESRFVRFTTGHIDNGCVALAKLR